MFCSRHNAVAPVRLEPSVSCQALYHDSKSQLLNPENKLLYDMKKKIQLLFFRNNVFIFNLAKCVNDKAVEKTFRQLLLKVWCLLHVQIFVYSKTSKIRAPIFRNTG